LPVSSHRSCLDDALERVDGPTMLADRGWRGVSNGGDGLEPATTGVTRIGKR
jgi:hypothetical protein